MEGAEILNMRLRGGGQGGMAYSAVGRYDCNEGERRRYDKCQLIVFDVAINS
ncbi:hypothetical protein JCM21142_72946 [Saccharicrinis fermentans DSM 9555 = JCM 21142]|uniref:Uncharacterized protein n=1 Tax=Saccharicrinis fermentans DSM 9555 = JCM 21142 TaxID=869213 RepID=W7YPD4_9BACT|nr:hypothetical protein JCM21142_72946 [Saccharicrinis fermentans DSM 9555 = JCM 21142]